MGIKATFNTKIKGDGNNAGIEVPAEVIATLGNSKKPPVIVTVGGYTYRNTVAVMGGLFMISLSKAHREASGLKAGDEVEVTLELDDEPRTVDVPDDLAAALAEQPGIREKFDGMSYSKRKEFVRQVEDAKTEDTRIRRIAKVVATVSEV